MDQGAGRGEFANTLAATATGRDQCLACTYYIDFADPLPTSHHHGRYCTGFGAGTLWVRGIFNIAGTKSLAIVRHHNCAYFEP